MASRIKQGPRCLRACREADIEPTFKEYTGDSPVSWVLSQNVKRRDLSATQRATIGFESLPLLENEAKARQHAAGVRGNEGGRGNKKTLQEKVPGGNGGQARTHAAKAVGVNDRYISDVKKIVTKAPELLEKMKSGEVTISEAQQQLGLKQTVATLTMQIELGVPARLAKRAQKESKAEFAVLGFHFNQHAGFIQTVEAPDCALFLDQFGDELGCLFDRGAHQRTMKHGGF